MLQRRELADVCKEALLAIDRLRSDPPTPDLVASVVDELLEVFGRRGLEQVDDGGSFDPRFHEVVGTIEPSEIFPAGTICAVHRAGYVLEGRLLRASRVTIARGPQRPQNELINAGH
ncbi:nucleotide exchange factor GrpE [Arthrobacter sp. CJ23]|uniref:nucleotide exchange factor GrpE n=1 Tax=Arthrobacter sp. CJ23 TaxID=2972479 RepID=UPI0037C11B6F